MSTSELACTYAALILHDVRLAALSLPFPMACPAVQAEDHTPPASCPLQDGLEITTENLNTILKAANVAVEPYWPTLFAKLFAKKSIGDLITNVGAGEQGRAVDSEVLLLPLLASHAH